MKNKVILDEMQQKTLLEIEHKTLHIALTGLLIVILMQQIFWKDGQNTLGESAVLLISSGYLLLSYIKNGIWDRTKPFSAKSNRDHQPAGQSGNGYLLGSDQPAALP